MIPKTMIEQLENEMRSIPAQHQTDPAKAPGQVNTPPPVKAQTLGDYIKRFEATPDGKSQHEDGAKLDKGKNRVAMVEGQFARALSAVYQVGTDGAAKYTDGGWLWVENGFARYSDAEGRHRLKRAMGETRDPDSGSLHLAHEAWNSLAKLELYLREQEKVKDSK